VVAQCRFDALRPEGLRFESQSSRYVGLGQVLHSQLPVALRHVNWHSINGVVGSASE